VTTSPQLAPNAPQISTQIFFEQVSIGDIILQARKLGFGVHGGYLSSRAVGVTNRSEAVKLKISPEQI